MTTGPFMDPTVKRNRDWFRLCDHFIEAEDPCAGCYCKLRAGHDGEHSQHYPPALSKEGTNMETQGRGIAPEALDAVESAYFAWERFRASTKPLSQADALVDLSNAMSDVASWIPGYDPETGEVNHGE